MDSYTLESFINFCDDMQIAEEGLREGNGIIDKIINTLQRGYEWIRRAILRIKEKSSKGKYVVISKKVHTMLTELERDIASFHNSDANKLDDGNMEKIKEDVNETLKLAEEHKYDNDQKSAIPVAELYQNMQVESKNISSGIKFAEECKRKGNISREYIHRLSNEVDLMHLHTKINNFYLSCPVTNEKNVNTNENPDSQVVTQNERDKYKNR